MVKFYNKRGTAEQWIKEGKYALNWTRLSCHDFVDNQVRLQLFALAYNIGDFLRHLSLPKSMNDWSLRTMRVKLVKIGAKVVSHARLSVSSLPHSVNLDTIITGELSMLAHKRSVVRVLIGDELVPHFMNKTIRHMPAEPLSRVFEHVKPCTWGPS